MCEINEHVFRQYNILDKFQSKMDKSNSVKHYVTTKDKVPLRLRHPYVETGYRPTPLSYYECAKSAFYLNNEFVNFWTHFIPLIWMANRLYWLLTTLDDPFNNVYYTLYLHCLGSMYLLLVSCIAHLFSAHSAKKCNDLFEIDALGIVCYGMSMQLGFEHLVCPIRCFAPISGLTSSVYAAFLMTYCITKTSFLCRCNDPIVNMRHLKYIPHVISIVLINLPCLYRFFFHYGEKTCWSHGNNYAYLYQLQAILTIINFSFFGLRFPEKYFKGTFDIFGQSHQIFHVGIAINMFVQNTLFELTAKNLMQDLKTGVISKEDINSIWSDTILYYTVLVASIHLIVFFYHKYFHSHSHKD